MSYVMGACNGLTWEGNVINDGGGTGFWNSASRTFTVALEGETAGFSYVVIEIGGCGCVAQVVTLATSGTWPPSEGYVFAWLNGEIVASGSSLPITGTFSVRAGDELTIQFDNNSNEESPAMNCTIVLNL